MARLNQPFTVGKYIARVGSEKTFIHEWTTFARWTANHQPGSGIGYLLQDPERPQQFTSFGPWENVEAIKDWRERPEFKAFVARVRQLCEDFQPQSLVLVACSEH